MKKTAEVIRDFTIWNTYLYLVRKLSLAAWTFKQQPFHFELLNSETPVNWKKAKHFYTHCILHFSLHELYNIRYFKILPRQYMYFVRLHFSDFNKVNFLNKILNFKLSTQTKTMNIIWLFQVKSSSLINVFFTYQYISWLLCCLISEPVANYNPNMMLPL